MQAQLALGVTLHEDMTFDNFYAGTENQAILFNLRQFINRTGENFIFLWGREGVGISHLLQACCHEIVRMGEQAIYLSLSETYLQPEVLQDLEAFQLICLDDIDSVLGQTAWESALFYLYNCASEKNVRLLVAAKHAPAILNCKLPDLHSRLLWGLALPVNLLADEEKLIALQIRAQNRGLVLADDVGQFLLRHCARNMTTLFNLLDRLDAASLAAKRRLTIPFIKQALCYTHRE
jgi:DnaA family protein